MRAEGLDLLVQPQVLSRSGCDVASGRGDEAVRRVFVHEAIECALRQLGDDEVTLGVAQSLLDVIVGDKGGQPSIVTNERRVPDQKFAIVACLLRRSRRRIFLTMARNATDTDVLIGFGVHCIRKAGVDRLDIGLHGLSGNGGVSSKRKSARQGRAQNEWQSNVRHKSPFPATGSDEADKAL